MSRSLAPPITRAEQLARQMVEPARRLRAAAAAALTRRPPSASLQAARQLVVEAVSPELAEPERAADLADTLVQGLALALFQARLDAGDAPQFVQQCGRGEAPLACPAQRRWADSFLHALGGLRQGRPSLDELVRLLAGASMPEVLASLGGPGRQDAGASSAHGFYEQFLACYDSAERRRRGVYATPASAVAYLIHSADHVLRTEFGWSAGLAHCLERPQAEGAAAPHGPPPLRIVDPACGTGVFLGAVLQHLRRTVVDRKGPDAWRSSLRPRLAESLVGFEVLPASCAAAQFLLQRELPDAEPTEDSIGGLSPPRNGPPPIRLSNPLEADEPQQADWLGLGAARPVLAILGNPPYANFGRCNRGPWIRGLLEDYKRGLHEKKVNLDDDFIKFIRWAQFWIDRAGQGVLAFITNSSYLTGLTHRQMRRSLLRSFDKIYVLDLHGEAVQRCGAPAGVRDENVFAIRTPVAIGVFVKRRASADAARVFHAERWGSQEAKHRFLSASHVGVTPWTPVSDSSNFSFFTPRAASAEQELKACPRLDQLFAQYVSGVQTKHDALWVAFTREELAERIQAMFGGAQPGAELDRRLPGSPASDGGLSGAAVERLAQKAAGLSYREECLQPYLVAPFDRRWVYYEPRLLGRARYAVMRHLLHGGAPGLVFMRQSTSAGQYDHVLAVNSLASDRVFYSAHGAPFVAPLHVRRGESQQPNLQPAAVDQFAARLQLRFATRLQLRFSFDGRAKSPARFDAEDVFHYAYALLHSPAYRARYEPALRIDFPRIPITTNRELFWGLCGAGERLAAAHLREAPAEGCASLDFPVAGENLVAPGYPKFVSEEASCGQPSASGRLYINSQQYFDSIDNEVWNFRIGGYPVLPRWFKQRRRRRLSDADIAHATLTMQALRETIALMAEIDTLIPRWPMP